MIGTRGTKITRIGSLAASPALESLCLRSNLIGRMHSVAGQTALKHLELYENRIRALEGLEGMTCEWHARADRRSGALLPPAPPRARSPPRPPRSLPPTPSSRSGCPCARASHCGTALTVLDMSYNKIREMEGMGDLRSLSKLFLASNKLREIKGLESTAALTGLDLGMNKIRAIEGVSHLTGLRELWLGKNKIPVICGLESLTNLRRLDVQVSRAPCATVCGGVTCGFPRLPCSDPALKLRQNCGCSQSNRLTKIEGLSTLTKLEELFLGHNAIETIEGLEELVSVSL